MLVMQVMRRMTQRLSAIIDGVMRTRIGSQQQTVLTGEQNVALECDRQFLIVEFVLLSHRKPMIWANERFGL